MEAYVRVFVNNRWIDPCWLEPHLLRPTSRDILAMDWSLPRGLDIPWIDRRNRVMATIAADEGDDLWPTPPFVAGNFAFTNFAIAANAAAKVAFIFSSPRGGDVSKLHFMTGTVTTGDTLDIRLETVGSGGDPSGTLVATNTNASQAVVAGTDNAKTFQVTLTANATLTMGAMYAMVIANGAVPGNLNIRGITRDARNVPYNDIHNGTSWTKGTTCPLFSLHWTTAPTYKPISGVWPISGLTVTSFHQNNVTADERGIIFQRPFPWQVHGAWLYTRLVSGADFDVVLYDTDGTTVLASTSCDGDHVATNSDTVMNRYFNTSVNLSANVNYRLVYKPTTTTNMSVTDVDVDGTIGAGLMDALPGGQAVHHTQRVDAGAWSQTTTKRTLIGLMGTGYDDGAGSGGMKPHPGMRGNWIV